MGFVICDLSLLGTNYSVCFYRAMGDRRIGDLWKHERDRSVILTELGIGWRHAHNCGVQCSQHC